MSEAVGQRCSVKKDFLGNFAKFTGKHLCQSLFFSKKNFIKKETLAQIYSCEFCEIFENTIFYRTPLVAASVKTTSTGVYLHLPITSVKI